MSRTKPSFGVLLINAALISYLSVTIYMALGTLIDSGVVLIVAPTFASIGAAWFCIDFRNYGLRIQKKPVFICAGIGPFWPFIRWPVLRFIKSGK